MGSNDGLGIGLLGLGVVGSGVAKILTEKAKPLTLHAGRPLELRRILVRNPEKERSIEVPSQIITTDSSQVLKDSSIDILIEVIGGEHPALQFIQEALSRGKHVVTANKEVMAKHGPELLEQAGKQGVQLRYEASVGGGIPIISPFAQDLLANKISSIKAIINGTTNYILTQMVQQGWDFPTALKKAQELGYAEPDPTNDIEGIDAAYKLAIMATLAFQTEVRSQDIYCEGISRLEARDFTYAQELGYAIKLLAIAKEEDNAIQARVHPTLIPQELLLAKVEGVFNAVQVEGDMVGQVLFYGRGAGARPTASAIIADLIEIANNINQGKGVRPKLQLDASKRVKTIWDIETKYYIRMWVSDKAGVLAQIARILADREISLASLIQKEADEKSQTAEIVLMTHPAREASMQKALEDMAKLEVVKEVSNFIRVED